MGASSSRASGPTLYRSYGNEVHNYFRNYDNILRVDHHGRWGTPNSQMNWKARGPFWYHFFDIEVHPVGSSQSSIVGGNRTYTHNGYTVHVFSEPGDAELSVGPNNVEADILVVAGGGGGGNVRNFSSAGGGGGGAGGLVFRRNYTLSSGSKVSITVGKGADRQTSSNRDGNDGEDSKFESITAIGGGGGGWRNRGGGPARDGGSGGGSRREAHGTTSGGRGVQGGTGGHGNDGGDGVGGGGNSQGGAGGGGAGAKGSSNSGRSGGEGGQGMDLSSHFGESVGDNGWFAGGGAGGTFSSSANVSGGRGGGGRGVGTGQRGGDGKPNTGGGGGGAGSRGGRPGKGGHGIVIVRYRA